MIKNTESQTNSSCLQYQELSEMELEVAVGGKNDISTTIEDSIEEAKAEQLLDPKAWVNETQSIGSESYDRGKQIFSKDAVDSIVKGFSNNPFNRD